MALRSRACLDPGVLEGFGYRAGFPVERFPADVLVEFLVSACRARPPMLDRKGTVSSEGAAGGGPRGTGR